jgi:hypothetical protein
MAAGSGRVTSTTGSGRRHDGGDRPVSEKVVVRTSDFGIVWIIGWMFAIGFLKLGLWKALLGIIVWPYFLGAALAR